MEVYTVNDSNLIISFDCGNSVKVSKAMLIEESLYFQAMFSGQFMESQLRGPILLQHVSYIGFVNTVKCVLNKAILNFGLEDLFFLFETAQFLQFTNIMEQAIQFTIKRYFCTSHIPHIFTFSYRLGLKDLYQPACAYIIFNFKRMLFYGRPALTKLPKEGLLYLLQQDGVNVKREVEVYYLVCEWLQSHPEENEYEVILDCVRFNDMDKNQLKQIILKTTNIKLKNMINHYISELSYGIPMLPTRRLPYVLCTMQNDAEGYVYMYQWDWEALKFQKTLKVDPLPVNAAGYQVVVKELEIYVLAGEIGYQSCNFIKKGWKYNFITKEWMLLTSFTPSERSSGLGYFCGDDLFLIGGRTQNNLPNELVEHFKVDRSNDTLRPLDQKRDSYIMGKSIEASQFTCLEYRGQFVFIQKHPKPKWYGYHFGEHVPLVNYESNISFMHINAIIICASVYRDMVYLLVYNTENVISLIAYIPSDQTHRRLLVFSTPFDEHTMCAFNEETAMVFSKNILEIYNIREHVHKDYEIQLNSFKFEEYFNIPIY